ncbi:molecular chaperone [Janthinobacterium lividum]|uniref:fimbrial biogenesis chaperone n=1 Tax=Janthinobacterium lividum TaxID=29581 RepID=UPI0008747306|nr:fimbria/pilus periplasmic chaperone [Janthinobacterium lividum]MCC7716973.1 fimbria/pilus periplasmic chaperone [Janthinobacterium lividum]OEZ53458.1 chaperone protein EcpD precursor [Janthinobacterium lividum]WQE31921.1 fimbria/pilus periplasmic chaperone [Janthinobacterium lividum]STS86191.1 Chaperone protein fimC precursor [Janthinobacterium lividum]
MSRHHPLHCLLILSMASLFSTSSMASVVITGTRQIYPANQKEITVKLNNEGSHPALVQSWIDTGDVTSTPTTSKAPFVLTPPLARIDPGKGQSLRLMFIGTAMPAARESVFWLNVLEIPPKLQESDSNTLQMAFRSRIKIFYRPVGLPGSPGESIEQLQWRVVHLPQGAGFALEAYNPSAFHISLVGVSLVTNAQRNDSEDGMVAPGETKQFALPTLKSSPGADAQVDFSAINDYGAQVPTRRPLSVPAVRSEP